MAVEKIEAVASSEPIPLRLIKSEQANFRRRSLWERAVIRVIVLGLKTKQVLEDPIAQAGVRVTSDVSIGVVSAVNPALGTVLRIASMKMDYDQASKMPAKLDLT